MKTIIETEAGTANLSVKSYIRSTFTIRRTGVYLIGLCIYAYAVCLMARANLGISPITSIAFVFTLFTPYSLGVTQFVVNVCLVLIQVIWLRKDFERLQYLQIFASLLFSVFIDATTPLVAAFPIDTIPQRLLLFVLSMFVMAFGLSIVAIANLVMLPGDGIAKSIAFKTGWIFGKAKVLNDVCCVIFTCIVALSVLHRIASVSLGTVVAALVLGNIARFYMRHIRKPLEKFIGIEVS